MVKAIFFDIDGTLLSFRTHRIPQSTLDEVARVRREGVRIFIATGRSIPFIRSLEGLEYDGIMSVNGASCVTSGGETITCKAVPRDDIRRLIEDARLHPMPVAFTSRDRAIVANPDSNREHFEGVFNLLDIPFPPTRPIEDALDMEVLQVIAFFNEEQEPRVMSEVLRGCDSNRWHPHFSDCVAKGTNKATGIDDICRYYGIDVADTVAFGDGGNDIAMLEHAGIGVAMGNASDEVKSHADMVTDSVDDDGVAKALRRLV